MHPEHVEVFFFPEFIPVVDVEGPLRLFCLGLFLVLDDLSVVIDSEYGHALYKHEKNQICEVLFGDLI